MPAWIRAMALALSMLAHAPAFAQAAPAAPTPRFDILEYTVEGNTVLSVPAIEAALLPFLGEGRQIGDVDAARESLEKAYQGAGFLTVFVDVPEQRVDSGVVRLAVTEGRVERLKVSGSRYFSQGHIRDRVVELAEGTVPNFNEVQRQLAGVNRSEDRRVQPVLRPGKTPGTVEAELKVVDRLPLSGNVELNNRHAADTEPLRLAATLRYDNLFQRDHSLSVTAITAPQQTSQSQVLTGTYTVPLDSGNTFVAYAVWSDSTVEPLGATTVLGKGSTYGLRYVVPLSTAGDAAHSLSLGADYKDLRERIDAGTGSLSTPLRYLPLQLAYNGSWQGENSSTQLSSTFTFGLRGLLARRVACPTSSGFDDQFSCKRQGADGGFSSLKADWRHTMATAWRSSVVLRLAGQFASQPLVSSEQFSAGGAESVRGYLESEASGDHGLLGSVEWRSPNWAGTVNGSDTAWFDEFTALGFIDVARTQLSQAAEGQAARTPLLGTGVGLRVRAVKKLAAEIDIAWPHKPSSRNPDNDPRLHVKLAVQF